MQLYVFCLNMYFLNGIPSIAAS